MICKLVWQGASLEIDLQGSIERALKALILLLTPSGVDLQSASDMPEPA